MGRKILPHAMVGIAMFIYIYANIRTNTYTNTYANFIDCKGGAAEGRPTLLVYSHLIPAWYYIYNPSMWLKNYFKIVVLTSI